MKKMTQIAVGAALALGTSIAVAQAPGGMTGAQQMPGSMVGMAYANPPVQVWSYGTNPGYTNIRRFQTPHGSGYSWSTGFSNMPGVTVQRTFNTPMGPGNEWVTYGSGGQPNAIVYSGPLSPEASYQLRQEMLANMVGMQNNFRAQMSSFQHQMNQMNNQWNNMFNQLNQQMNQLFSSFGTGL